MYKNTPSAVTKKSKTFPLKRVDFTKHFSVLLPERLTAVFRPFCPFGTRLARASPECYPIAVPNLAIT